MKKYLYYDNREDGKIKMVSDEPIETQFDMVEQDFTEQELDDFYTKPIKKYKDGKIIYEETQEEISKKNIKDKLNKATTIKDVKDVLMELI
jgi:hypothetical protein